MEKLLTVREVAKIEKTSVQNIYSRIKRKEIETVYEKSPSGRKVMLLKYEVPEEEDEIKQEEPEEEEVKQEEIKQENTELELLKKTIDIIENQLKEKDKQIEVLNNQIDNLSRMLDQSQQLQALSIKNKLELEANNEEKEEEGEKIGYKEPEEEPKGFWHKLGYWLTH